MTRLARTLLVALGFLALLGSAASVRATPAERRPAPPTGPERYRIGGSPASDDCGGRIVLAARIITLDRARRTLFADVVNRTYAARYRADTVVASGQFESRSACPGGVTEAWDLRRSGPDELSGMLESNWLLAPDCTPCTIRFRIRAVRIR